METNIKIVEDVQRYDVRVGMDWAIFNISTKGLFSVYSTYGTYAYGWWHHGAETFKHFLCDLEKDSHYAMSKLGKKDLFVPEVTIKEMYKDILLLRRCDDLSKAQARKAIEELYSLEKSCFSGISVDFFVNEVAEYEELSVIFPHYDSLPIHFDYRTELKMFMDIMFTVFVQQLKKEISHSS